MCREKVLFTILALALTVSVLADDLQNSSRGFSPDSAFQMTNVDYVNLFNGTITLSVPIAPSFPLDGGASYGVHLVYTGRPWDYLNGSDNLPYPTPNRRSNAGIGWRITLGRLITPSDPSNPSCSPVTCSLSNPGSWVYESTDGSDHMFYNLLHSTDDPTTVVSGVYYTRDGSYLRLHVSSSTEDLEFPDGSVHSFDLSGRLTGMRTAFESLPSVSVTYLNNDPAAQPCNNEPNPKTSSCWKITDKLSRTQWVMFAYDGNLYQGQIATEILLSGPNGSTVRYSLGYNNQTLPDQYSTGQDQTVARDNTQCYTPSLTTGAASFTIPFLTTVALPDGSSWSFHYTNVASPGVFDCQQASLDRVTLPTLGTIDYVYTTPWMDTLHAASTTVPPSLGIKTRALTAADTGTQQRWSYATALGDESPTCQVNPCPPNAGEFRQFAVTVTDPQGANSTHYFSVARHTYTDEPSWTPAEYGLPLTHAGNSMTVGGQSSWLSTDEYDGANVARRTWVTYEETGTAVVNHAADAHRRLKQSAVQWLDSSGNAIALSDGTDTFTTVHSSWDNMGHYRQTDTGSTNSSGSVTESRTSYADYISTVPSATSPWILGTYDYQTVAEGNTTAKSTYCFEPSTGFLQRVRTYTGATAGASDVIHEQVHDAVGNLTSERWYGGDSQTLDASTENLCSATLPTTPTYRVDHGYSSGVRSSSVYMNGSTAVLKFLDRTIDPTGFVLSEKDSTGLDSMATAYAYDTAGDPLHLSSLTPPGQAARYFQYSTASGSGSSFHSPQVTVSQGDEQNVYQYNAFGLLTAETHRVWSDLNGTVGTRVATRTTSYDSMNRKSAVSTWDFSATPAHSTAYSYDVFGRTTSITAPDGSPTSIKYTGGGKIERAIYICTTSPCPTDPAQQTVAITTEYYDAFGRLIKVTQPAGPTSLTTSVIGANQDTIYAYDVGNRLQTVTMTGPEGTQTRKFSYDLRGFLTSEQHPEKGVSGNGTVSYSHSYDARGHVLQKIENGDSAFNLTYKYDAAERLTEVDDLAPGTSTRRVLKSFDYATSNDSTTTPTNAAMGKLHQAIRHNYLPGGDDVQVQETYVYASSTGQPSQRTTTVTKANASLQTFTQKFTWNNLGLLAKLDYPTTCSSCTIGSAISGVSQTWTDGMLTAVASSDTTSTSFANSITYNASGMTHHVDHGTNGGATVRDEYAPDANGLPRPSSISFTGWADCTPPAAPSISAPTTFCVNSSATASVTPVTGATYSWAITGGTISSGASTASITFTASSAGTVTLTVTQSLSCSTQTATKNVTADQPTAVVSGSATIVYPGTAQIQANLTGMAPWTLTWSDGVTQTVSTSPAVRTVSPSVTTTYSVNSLSDGSGCTGTSSGSATITVKPPVPTGVTATTQSNTSYVLVTWNGVSPATSYVVERTTVKSGGWQPFYDSSISGCPLCTSWTDGPITPAALPITYLYRVRAVNGTSSDPSAFDYATTASVLFSDDPISLPPPGVMIKAVHIVELRKAVDAVRASAGLLPYTFGWSSYNPPTSSVSANDVINLRNGLDDAVSLLLGHPVSYTGATPATGGIIYGNQLQQIRQAVK